MKEDSGSEFETYEDSGVNYPVVWLTPGSGVVGYVSFNEGSDIAVNHEDGPSEVVPGVPIYALGEGSHVLVKTRHQSGGEWARYIFWQETGEGRQYFESTDPNGTSAIEIKTETINYDHLVLELVEVLERSVPTIVIGMVIIDVER